MKRHYVVVPAVLILVCLATAMGAAAQGVLVPESAARLPRPETSSRIAPVGPTIEYRISKIEVDAKLTDQIAEVLVSQSFVNTGSRQMEVSFVFPLPYDGAIDQLTLMVDGKEFPATLMKADKARAVYEGIVRQNKDPALLEWIGTGMFRTSVFPVPAGATRTVTLKYTQLCRRADGLTDFLFPLGTAKYTVKPVEKISVNLTIESADPIRNVYSPTQDVKVERPAENRAKVAWQANHVIPTSDFRLLYDSGKGQLTTRVLSYRPMTTDDGYFLLLANPAIVKVDKPMPKTVFFVVDTSGSMSGEKIVQAREAAKFLVNNLREGDSFNIMSFDSMITLFEETMQPYTAQTKKKALAFADGLTASGGTDINTAMTRTLELLANADDPNPKYVFFLTDGCPTVGVQDEMKIVDNAKKANNVKARIFAFGVGYDLNSRLLDKLVRESFGQSEYVKPDENIEERVSRLYTKLESPVMTNVKMTFTPAEGSEAFVKSGAMVNRVYPAAAFDLFAGDQLVISGRYKYAGKGMLKITGHIGDGLTQEFEYPLELAASSPDSRYAFAEKLWALRRIGEIIDELDLRGKNQEILDELIGLSTKHGILTPYTSFLADENSSLAANEENRLRVDARFNALAANTQGQAGVAQRDLKNQLQLAQNTVVVIPPPTATPAESMGGGRGGGGTSNLPGTVLRRTDKQQREPSGGVSLDESDVQAAMDAAVSAEALALGGGKDSASGAGGAGWGKGSGQGGMARGRLTGKEALFDDAEDASGKYNQSGDAIGWDANSGPISNQNAAGNRLSGSGSSSRPAVANAKPVSAKEQVQREQTNMQQNVRQVQNRTFFYKDNQWVDSSLTAAQQKAKPMKIKQFSDEYFDLIRKAEKQVAPFLVFDEAVLLCVNNKMVLIEP